MRFLSKLIYANYLPTYFGSGLWRIVISKTLLPTRYPTCWLLKLLPSFWWIIWSPSDTLNHQCFDLSYLSHPMYIMLHQLSWLMMTLVNYLRRLSVQWIIEYYWSKYPIYSHQKIPDPIYWSEYEVQWFIWDLVTVTDWLAKLVFSLMMFLWVFVSHLLKIQLISTI